MFKNADNLKLVSMPINLTTPSTCRNIHLVELALSGGAAAQSSRRPEGGTQQYGGALATGFLLIPLYITTCRKMGRDAKRLTIALQQLSRNSICVEMQRTRGRKAVLPRKVPLVAGMLTKPSADILHQSPPSPPGVLTMTPAEETATGNQKIEGHGSRTAGGGRHGGGGNQRAQRPQRPRGHKARGGRERDHGGATNHSKTPLGD